MPDQRLPFEAVIAAYTSGGAYALFAEARRGTLAPGMEADLVLLDGDPRGLSATPAACRAWLTVCDGVVVHEEAA